MSVEYNEKIFSNFFKEVQNDVETGITKGYTYVGENSTFLLHLFHHENRASLQVLNPPRGNPLFDIVIDDLNSVVCGKDFISFYNCDDYIKPVLTVTVRPFIILECDDVSKISFVFEKREGQEVIYTAYYEEQLKLLELFGNVRFAHDDNTIVDYKMTVENNLILDLHIWTYDEYAAITLFRPDKESWLFDVAVNRLVNIVYEGDALKFYREENKNEPAIVVTIKPHISLSCRAGVPDDRP